MEGVGGVKNWHYTEGKRLPEGNRLLVGEVRAAVRGARKAGVSHITICEGHGTSNLKSIRGKVMVEQILSG